MSKIKRIVELDEYVYKAVKIDNYPVCCTENIILVDAIKNSEPYDERPKGEWIPCTKSGMPLTEQGRSSGEKWYGFKCSNPECNYIYKGNALTESPFCQKCGADMQIKENSNG